MRRVIPALAGASLALLGGCSASEVAPLTATPASPEPVRIGTFDAELELGDGFMSPVVVVDRRQRLHGAAISQAEGWPVLLRGGAVVRLPGQGDGAAESLAMALGPEGRLHAVWSTWSGELWYARLDADTYAGEAVRVREREAHEPNLAVRDDGEVYIAYADGWYSRSPEWVPMGVSGSLDGGFGAPEPLMPDWAPDSWGRGAWRVQIGAVRFDPAQQVHVALVWTVGDGVLTYVRRDGQAFGVVHEVEGVSRDHAPGLLVDEGSFALAYVTADESTVRLVRSDAAETDTIVHEGEALFGVLLTEDRGGGRHLVFDSARAGNSSVEYRGLDPEASLRIRAAGRSPDTRLSVNARAGGVAWTADGVLLVPYIDQPSGGGFGRFSLAEGRATRE